MPQRQKTITHAAIKQIEINLRTNTRVILIVIWSSHKWWEEMQYREVKPRQETHNVTLSK